MLGLKAVEIPTDAVSGIDPEGLARALETNRIAACLFSSGFNNPLGCSVPDENRAAILRLLASREVPLIEDDTYGELFLGRDPVRPYSAFDGDGRVIYCGSFSKTIAPGYRVGWIAATRFMDRALEHKFATSLACPTLQQAALAEFLATGGFDRHLRRLRRAFSSGIANMSYTVGRAFPSGTRLSRPAGGFTLWLELPGQSDARTLLSKAMKAGIYFAPGDLFSADRRFSHCLRLSCGYGWEPRIREAVERLGQLARSVV
jgi:DNA-binding transcriptional MocR family regulator